MVQNAKRRARRQLTPEEKWEIFLEVTTQEISQADAARKYRGRCASVTDQA
jgi:transposase-like protein